MKRLYDLSHTDRYQMFWRHVIGNLKLDRHILPIQTIREWGGYLTGSLGRGAPCFFLLLFLLLLLLLHEEKVIFKANRSIKTSCLPWKPRRVFLIDFQLKISSFSAARVQADFQTFYFLPLLTFLTLELQCDFRLPTSYFRQLDREFNLVFHACPTLLVRIPTGIRWLSLRVASSLVARGCLSLVACCVFSGLFALMPVECWVLHVLVNWCIALRN